MLKGKGQITLFVIIGLVLLVIAGLIFFTTTNNFETTQNSDTKKNQELIESQIKACAEPIIQSTAQITAASGFFAKQDIGYGGVPALYISERTILKELKEIETEFGKKLDSHLIECLNNFSRIENLTTGTIKNENPILENTISIGDEYITTIIKINTKISSSGEIYEFQNIVIEQKSSLGTIYKATTMASSFEKNQIFDEKAFDEYLKQKQLYGFANLGSIPGSIEFTIAEPKGTKENEPLQIQFLVIP